jgi:hypothetical protein
VSCWIRRIKNPAELVFVLFLLLDPPDIPAELVFVLFLLLNPPEYSAELVFVAESAGIPPECVLLDAPD